MRKHRGVFVGKDGRWWIEYWDADGKRRREKAGTLGTAKQLVERRRDEARKGIKMPENLRAKPVTFSELTAAALRHSEPVEKGTNHSRMKVLVAEFGDSPAEEITPTKIEAWLESQTQWTLATKNHYIALMKLAYRLAEKARR